MNSRGLTNQIRKVCGPDKIVLVKRSNFILSNNRLDIKATYAVGDRLVCHRVGQEKANGGVLPSSQQLLT